MKATIYHVNLTAANDYRAPNTTLRAMAAFLSGYYYKAGEVEVGSVDFDGVKTSLERAYYASQNDTQEPEYDGYESGMPKQVPARWNEKFAQRSTMVGDAVLLEGQLFLVTGSGFQRMAWGEAAETFVGEADHVDNPYDNKPAPSINKEFDDLVFRGE